MLHLELEGPAPKEVPPLVLLERGVAVVERGDGSKYEADFLKPDPEKSFEGASYGEKAGVAGVSGSR